MEEKITTSLFFLHPQSVIVKHLDTNGCNNVSLITFRIRRDIKLEIDNDDPESATLYTVFCTCLHKALDKLICCTFVSICLVKHSLFICFKQQI